MVRRRESSMSELKGDVEGCFGSRMGRSCAGRGDRAFLRDEVRSEEVVKNVMYRGWYSGSWVSSRG